MHCCFRTSFCYKESNELAGWICALNAASDFFGFVLTPSQALSSCTFCQLTLSTDFLSRGGNVHFYSQCWLGQRGPSEHLAVAEMRFVERGNFWVVGTRADLILLWYKAGFPSLSCRSIVYPACQALIKKLQGPAPAPASLILALLWCEPTP